MRRVCVYLGSSPGHDPAYRAAAESLAACLVERGLGLVYGGAQVGTMGVIADAVSAAGGEVIGVLPAAMRTKEIAHSSITELHVVESMHERKLLMMDLADAFIALPGGIGTLEELFETFSWLLLGLHRKPIGLLDVGGFWTPLTTMIDRTVDAGFTARSSADLLLVDDDPDALLDAFGRWEPPPLPQWLQRSDA